MGKWVGAAGVCINERNELLMVLQGKPEETKMWSIPSGGVEHNETFVACCIREVEEETGYQVEVLEKLQTKTGYYEEIDIAYEVHYFSVRKVAGTMTIQDPDELIHEIAWKTIEDIHALPLCFPEDRDYLLNLLNENRKEEVK